MRIQSRWWQVATIAALVVFESSPVIAAQNTRITTANAVVNVTNGLAISKNADLVFGSIAQPLAGDTVVMTPAGVRTSTTLTFGSGIFGAASFTVSRVGGGGGNPHFTITLPASVTLNGSGGGTMLVDTFTSNPSGSGFAVPPTIVTVGATLHVGALQPVGLYTGTFNVTVTNQ